MSSYVSSTLESCVWVSLSLLLFFEALVAKSACLRFLLDPGAVAAEAALELTPVSTPIVAPNLLVGGKKPGMIICKVIRWIVEKTKCIESDPGGGRGDFRRCGDKVLATHRACHDKPLSTRKPRGVM